MTAKRRTEIYVRTNCLSIHAYTCSLVLKHLKSYDLEYTYYS